MAWTRSLFLVSVSAKMSTEALLSLKLALSRYCYVSPELTGNSSQKRGWYPSQTDFPYGVI